MIAVSFCCFPHTLSHMVRGCGEENEEVDTILRGFSQHNIETAHDYYSPGVTLSVQPHYTSPLSSATVYIDSNLSCIEPEIFSNRGRDANRKTLAIEGTHEYYD